MSHHVPDSIPLHHVGGDRTPLMVAAEAYHYQQQQPIATPHGADPTDISEHSWRVSTVLWAIVASAVILATFAFAVALWTRVDKLSKSDAHDGTGFADACSSTGAYSATGAACVALRESDLPMVIRERGACVRFDRDVVYGGNATDGPAIEWFGARGEIHGCGHNFTLTHQSGQGILVHGSFADDSDERIAATLTAYDLTVVAPAQQYDNRGYAVRAQYGAALTLEDATFANFYTAVDVRDATLRGRGVNVTATLSLDDEARALAFSHNHWAFDSFGINCEGTVDCAVDDYTFFASNDDASGDYRDVPFSLQSVGFQCTNTSAGDAGFCRLERADITAAQGVVIRSSRSATLRDVSVVQLGGAENLFETTYWGDASDPANSPTGFSIGVMLQFQEASAATVNGLTVDARGATPYATVNAGLQLSSTDGLEMDTVKVFGRAPRAEWFMAAEMEPFFSQLQTGLVSIDTVWREDAPVSPLLISRLIVRATDNTSYCVTVGASRVFEQFELTCATANITVSFDQCAFVGGAAGLLVGSGSTDQVAVTNSRFTASYYGVYAANGSSALLLERNYHTRHCEAVHVETNSSAVILANQRYALNSWDLVGSVAVDSDPLSTGETEDDERCIDVPFIYNIDPANCVAPDIVEVASAGVSSHRATRMAQIRDSLGL